MHLALIFLSFILPLQVQSIVNETQLAPPYWAVNTIIDASIILGLKNMRSKFPRFNYNPELYFRDPDEYDWPKSRRRQLIENYVHNHFTYSAK
jgi:hypothetical protein